MKRPKARVILLVVFVLPCIATILLLHQNESLRLIREMLKSNDILHVYNAVASSAAKNETTTTTTTSMTMTTTKTTSKTSDMADFTDGSMEAESDEIARFPSNAYNLVPDASSSTSSTTLNAAVEDDNIEPSAADGKLTSSFFVNHIMTTRRPRPVTTTTTKEQLSNSFCHRTCVDFRNKIYVLPLVEHAEAGLMDRLTVFGSVLNMAGYLCARVYVPRPALLLAPHHNSNQRLNANMTWSEFGDFQLYNDPDQQQQQQQALVDWDNLTRLDDPSILEQLSKATTGLFKLTLQARQVKFHFPDFESYTFAQQLHLKHNNNSNNNKHQDGGVEDGFIWVIRAYFYQWGNVLSHHLRYRPTPSYYKDDTERFREPFIFAEKGFYAACQYANVRLPRHVLELRDKIVNTINKLSTPPPDSATALQQYPPLVGYFHIRRHDTGGECDTSLNRIQQFLNCSLGDAVSRLSQVTPSAGSATFSRHMIILFSSDEVDPSYRHNVKQLIEQQQQRSNRDKNAVTTINVTFVDLDNLVEQTMRAEIEAGQAPAWRLNNFHEFQLILSIGYNRTIVQFNMEQRRVADCHVCNNVTAQLIKAGALHDDAG